ncbi:hypothetical protein HD806DRAFT_296110 [Xylariaceae sp. AK1471]|nr:hypothetical protein HD806DRAFT_296110 [Xylariaceae sp. AK1471]
MSGQRRPQDYTYASSYPPANVPARSETTSRYQTGVPPVRWGDVSRPGSSVAADPSRHDPYRAAHAATGGVAPQSSVFNTQNHAYKRQEDRGVSARTAYWKHNAAYDPQTSGVRYHQQGTSYAQNAASHTQKAIDERQRFGANFVGYDTHDSYRGHQERISKLKDKEADMRYYKNEHRDYAQAHSYGSGSGSRSGR